MNLTEAINTTRELMSRHGLTDWKIKLDKSLRRFGCCNFRTSTISLSRALVQINEVERVEDTILHEIAHALVGPNHGHDYTWQRKAREIGCTGRRCYDESNTVIAQMKYTGTCPNCHRTIQRMRLPKRLIACGACCKRFSRGRHDRNFAIQFTANSTSAHLQMPAPTASPLINRNSTFASNLNANNQQEQIMTKKKLSAEAEKKAREARLATQKPARKSKAAREALGGADALKRNAAASTRETEIAEALKLGIELGEDEFLTEPVNLPADATVKKIMSRGGKSLPQPIFKVKLPAAPAQSISAPARPAKKAAAPPNIKQWEKGSTEGERAQSVLKKISTATRDKPIVAAKQLSDHERAIARRLFAQGLVGRDKFEQGIGYFAATN